MGLLWLIILVIYGFVTGWQIEPLAWWLLLPLFAQDGYDLTHKKRG